MSDFLANLVTRALEPRIGVRPHFRSIFEPGKEHEFAGLREPAEPEFMDRPSFIEKRERQGYVHETETELPEPFVEAVPPRAAAREKWAEPEQLHETVKDPSASPRSSHSAKLPRPVVTLAAEHLAASRSGASNADARKPLNSPSLPQEQIITPPQPAEIKNTAPKRNIDAVASREPITIDREEPPILFHKAAMPPEPISDEESSARRHRDDDFDEREHETRPILRAQKSPSLSTVQPARPITQPRVMEPRGFLERPQDPGTFQANLGIRAAVRPLIASLQQPIPAAATPAPSIHVTIGRVEVRAAMPEQTTARRAPSRAPVMSLDDYLRKRAGGG